MVAVKKKIEDLLYRGKNKADILLLSDSIAHFSPRPGIRVPRRLELQTKIIVMIEYSPCQSQPPGPQGIKHCPSMPDTKHLFQFADSNQSFCQNCKLPTTCNCVTLHL